MKSTCSVEHYKGMQGKIFVDFLVFQCHQHPLSTHQREFAGFHVFFGSFTAAAGQNEDYCRQAVQCFSHSCLFGVIKLLVYLINKLQNLILSKARQ